MSREAVAAGPAAGPAPSTGPRGAQGRELRRSTPDEGPFIERTLRDLLVPYSELGAVRRGPFGGSLSLSVALVMPADCLSAVPGCFSFSVCGTALRGPGPGVGLGAGPGAGPGRWTGSLEAELDRTMVRLSATDRELRLRSLVPAGPGGCRGPGTGGVAQRGSEVLLGAGVASGPRGGGSTAPLLLTSPGAAPQTVGAAVSGLGAGPSTPDQPPRPAGSCS